MIEYLSLRPSSIWADFHPSNQVSFNSGSCYAARRIFLILGLAYGKKTMPADDKLASPGSLPPRKAIVLLIPAKKVDATAQHVNPRIPIGETSDART